MATSHDYDGTITRVAAATITAGSIFNDTADSVVGLALTSAASGANFIAKVEGLVKGVAANTGAAWTAGQALAYANGSGFTHLTSGLRVVANAAAARAATATTGDVILRLPGSLQA
jgi:hypothetical protein